MKQFIADDSLWEVFPEAKINVLVVKDILNQFSKEEKLDFSALFTEAKKEIVLL